MTFMSFFIEEIHIRAWLYQRFSLRDFFLIEWEFCALSHHDAAPNTPEYHWGKGYPRGNLEEESNSSSEKLVKIAPASTMEICEVQVN